MSSTLNQEEGKLEKISILKEELKSAIDDLTIEIEKTQNIGFESQHEIEKLNSEISVSKTKIENNLENITMFDDENKPIEFEQVAVIPLENDEILYAILIRSIYIDVICYQELKNYLNELNIADIAVFDYTDEGFSLTDKAGHHIESKSGYRCLLTVADGQIIYKH